jgi:hypothetical protein
MRRTLSPPTLLAVSGALCALALIALPSRALAQQAEAAAEALFRAGRDASQRGDAQTACDRFRESYRLEPALGTLLNIASCELELGQLSEAWRHFQDVTHALPAGDPRLALAHDKIAELDRKLARLTIVPAPGAAAGLEARLGEVSLGSASFGVALPFDPGSYTLEARAPEREPRRYPFALAPGERRVLEIDAGPVLPAPAPAPAPAGSADGARTAAFALFGTGAVGLVVSATCAALVLDRLSVVDDECDAHKQCSPEGLAAADAGNAFYAGSLISLGIALAASSVGAYLLLGADDEEPKARLLPTLAPHSVGAVVQLRFR